MTKTALSQGRSAGFILILIAIGVAWLTVRSVVINSLADQAPGLVEAIGPASARALIASADPDRLPRGGSPTQRQIALLNDAARQAPLYAAPYYARAFTLLHAGNATAAIRAMTFSARRDPRDMQAKVFLIEQLLRVGRLQSAIDQINSLFGISGGARDLVLEVLARLSNVPAAAPYVSQALKNSPSWHDDFLRYVSAHGGNQHVVFSALVSGASAGGDPSDRRANQEAFLNGLVAQHDYDRAYLAWINFLPEAEIGSVHTVFDGNFRGLPAPAPFNWQLTNDEQTSAEIAKESQLPGGNALSIGYFGQSNETIAEQMLLAAPGNYVFSVVGAVTSDGQFGGTLAWQLTCLPSGTVLPLRSIDASARGHMRLSAPVTLPATGCAAQKLALVGQAGEVAVPIQAEFTNVRLTDR